VIGIKKKFEKLISAISGAKETTYKKDDLQSVEDLILDCGRYIEKVNHMESAITVARFRMEPDEYREYVMNLDRSRKYAHDALVASVRVLDRLCRAYQVDPLYAGPDERIPVSEFAMDVVKEMFEGRKL
jgi:hypothetical protein